MNKLNIVLGGLLLLALGFIFYQNVITDDKINNTASLAEEEKQLYTCGMHPNIISDEPGTCPICEMKLTPLKKKKSGKSKEREILYWVAPMDPNEKYDSPGKSKMGMDLVPVYEDEVAGGGIVEIDPVTMQNMNVKTALVKQGVISAKIKTNGLLSTDETKEYHVNARTDGWVEKLYVNYTGQNIKKGEKLLDIYSPKLISAQKEYLAALKYNNELSESSMESVSAGGGLLISAAYEKLEYLGMSYSEIFDLENNGEVKEHVSITSPSNGTVIKKDVIEGKKIKPGEQLFHIADLSKVWVIADVYENEVNSLKPGNKATVTISGVYNESYSGSVSFIYPVADNLSHTVKVRIELDNKNGELKPGMVANVEIMGKSSVHGPLVPESAVIRSGAKNIVIVAMGEGKFKPVEIKTGMYSDGLFSVNEGLAPGMRVVTSAQFLIDSESNLKSALDDFSSASEMQDMNMEADNSPEKQEDHSGHNHSGEAHNHQVQEEKGNEYEISSPLIRTGIIDVESIDGNKDGMLYECPMDWNIISDDPGNCPSCNMKLKEYSTDEIKENLTKHGYQYKK